MIRWYKDIIFIINVLDVNCATLVIKIVENGTTHAYYSADNLMLSYYKGVKH